VAGWRRNGEISAKKKQCRKTSGSENIKISGGEAIGVKRRGGAAANPSKKAKAKERKWQLSIRNIKREEMKYSEMKSALKWRPVIGWRLRRRNLGNGNVYKWRRQ
jgi:hypothetical protein